MPDPAVKSEFPPEVLNDREYGWGSMGGVAQYPQYKDGEGWPETPVHGEFVEEQPETSDERDTGWYRNGELISD